MTVADSEEEDADTAKAFVGPSLVPRLGLSTRVKPGNEAKSEPQARMSSHCVYATA